MLVSSSHPRAIPPAMTNKIWVCEDFAGEQAAHPPNFCKMYELSSTFTLTLPDIGSPSINLHAGWLSQLSLWHNVIKCCYPSRASQSLRSGSPCTCYRLAVHAVSYPFGEVYRGNLIYYRSDGNLLLRSVSRHYVPPDTIAFKSGLKHQDLWCGFLSRIFP